MTAPTPPAEPAEPVTAREVARQVFALCEHIEDMPESPADSFALERFTAGQRFAAKQIRRGIGTWLTDEENLRGPAPPQAASTPIDMVLFCPWCGAQHIDASDDSRCPIKCQKTPQCSEPCGEWCGWTNPPHRSHLCHGCGYIWRPADVPTNGVAAVKTKGRDDHPMAASRLVTK